jgi:response regulator RpfG family c-di-GMP phosphodiesterase
MNDRVLCVDDDAAVLNAYVRGLRGRFPVDMADGGEKALEQLNSLPPNSYAAIVSDMRMPGMDGIEFLSRARAQSPDSVRIMFTAHADPQATIEAVNEACIFKFLSKPCPSELLIATLEAAISHYQLVRTERDLLSKTLTSCAKLLADVLALAKPKAFSHGVQLRHILRQVGLKTGFKPSWELEIAVFLSQIGCICVPDQVFAKVEQGVPLTSQEMASLESHPRVGRELVEKIPRLSHVAELIGMQARLECDADASPDGSLLRLLVAFEQLLSRGRSAEEAMADLRRQGRGYDPHQLNMLETAMLHSGPPDEIKALRLDDLEDGMILEEQVRTCSGNILLNAGQEITPALRERIASHARSVQPIREPIRVRIPAVATIDGSLPSAVELAS